MFLCALPHCEFDRFYALLEASFPIDEYRPYDAQKALLTHPAYEILTNYDHTAMLTLWRFPHFVYAEHFVVAPGGRNQGTGTKMLQRLLSDLEVPLILEAELPETDMAIRRLGFYQRNGFFVNSYPYEQPAYGPGRSPVPLRLLSTAPLSPSDFERIKATLYREVYHVQ